MIDLKPEIKAAMEASTSLNSLLGGAHIWLESSPEATSTTYIVYFELHNGDDQYADDIAYDSEIHFQVSVFSKVDTFPVANVVDSIMKQLGFTRTSAQDFVENGAENRYYHKAMRFKIYRDF